MSSGRTRNTVKVDYYYLEKAQCLRQEARPEWMNDGLEVRMDPITVTELMFEISQT
jgi:hypothetical protein